jgi:hypothetical protein
MCQSNVIQYDLLNDFIFKSQKLIIQTNFLDK